MGEFWETNFIEKQTMWGFEPAESAMLANDIFVKNNMNHPPMKFMVIICHKEHP
ncbi:MAG: hypothetical protein LBV72_09765 [Tannerella sp.]|jgi:hypothetical protein|nr:hypothetical protein [Tannerella sp.]